jgi:UDP-glucose 4-epimerase
MKVLITGVSGVLARMVAEKCVAHGHSVLGIDRRPWPDAPHGVQMFRVDIRKRPAEEVFRVHRPDVLIHMATVTHFSAPFEERYQTNLGGTRRLFDYAEAYGVKQTVFVGRHTVYGAAADSPLYHTENDPPLGGSTFPELADLVAADLFAAAALWRTPKIRTCVLRLVYTLGPSRRGTLAGFLSGPMVLGFDPLYHFMHEQDAADAILLAATKKLRGVFNVAGPSPVPLSVLCRAVGKPAVPVLESVFPHICGRFGFSKLPRGAVNHVKYPVVVSAEPFAAATGFTAAWDEASTMESFRWA